MLITFWNFSDDKEIVSSCVALTYSNVPPEKDDIIYLRDLLSQARKKVKVIRVDKIYQTVLEINKPLGLDRNKFFAQERLFNQAMEKHKNELGEAQVFIMDISHE